MRISTFIAFLSVLGAGISGCTSETAKRTTYETLQNVREQECNKTPTIECDDRKKYETYQKQRQLE